MKIFFDTEFTGLHQYTTLISIGLVAENNATFYAEFTDYDETQLNDWLRTNVIKNLQLREGSVLGVEHTSTGTIRQDVVRDNTETIKKHLEDWLAEFEKVEMWSDCLAYDWVLFCQIFDGAFHIPKNIYYIPFDICTLFKLKGIDPDISREPYAFDGTDPGRIQKHNALWDAHVIKKCYDKLTAE